MISLFRHRANIGRPLLLQMYAQFAVPCSVDDAERLRVRPAICGCCWMEHIRYAPNRTRLTLSLLAAGWITYYKASYNCVSYLYFVHGQSPCRRLSRLHFHHGIHSHHRNERRRLWNVRYVAPSAFLTRILQGGLNFPLELVRIPGAPCSMRIHKPWFQNIFAPIIAYEIVIIFLASSKAISQYGSIWFNLGRRPTTVDILLRDSVIYPSMCDFHPSLTATDQVKLTTLQNFRS